MKKAITQLLTLWLALTLTNSIFAAEEHAVSPEIYFRADGPTPEIANFQIEKFLHQLKNDKILPTKKVDNPEGMTALDFLFKNRIIFSKANFTHQLNRLMCELNSTVCNLRLVSKKISGNNYRIRWKNQVGQPLVIPDINFEITSSYQPFNKKKGESLANEIVNNRKGCISFNDICKLAVLNLNRGDNAVLDDDYTGTVIVPSFGLEAFLYPGSQKQLNQETNRSQTDDLLHVTPETKADLDKKPTSIERAFKESILGKKQLIETNTKLELGAPSSQEIVNSEFENRQLEERSIIQKTINDSRLGSGSEKGTHEQYRNLFNDLQEAPSNTENANSEESNHGKAIIAPSEEIEHCAMSDVMNSISKPEKFSIERRVNVGVVDKLFNGEHCRFKNFSFRTYQSGSSSTAYSLLNNQTQNCVCKMAKRFLSEKDHGTHVSTILSTVITQSNNGDLPLNRSPNIFGFQFKSGQASQRRLGELLSETSATQGGGLRVINFSIDIPKDNLSKGYTDNKTLESTLKTGLLNSLVVAAAGNQSMNLDKECSIFPACLKLNNVINVGALSKESNFTELSNGSNYGKKVMHVAAPGEVVAGAYNGMFVESSGTSQASPIVAAVATLMLSKNRTLPPYKIKNRIITSSDLLPELTGKALGGRINASRALSFGKNFIKFDVDSSGYEEKFLDRDIVYGNLYYCHFDQTPCNSKNNSGALDWDLIERLSRDQFGNYTVFIKDSKKLKKLTEITILNGNRTEGDDGNDMIKIKPGLSIKPKQIIDYVRRLDV